MNILTYIERQSAIILLYLVQIACLVLALARISLLFVFSLISELQSLAYEAQDWLQAILLPPPPAAPAKKPEAPAAAPATNTMSETGVENDGESG